MLACYVLTALFIGKIVDCGEINVTEMGTREIAREKNRGRAYQCLPCFHKKGRTIDDVKGRIEEYILKNHVKPDEEPFYCRLLMFRCRSWPQLERRIFIYAPHVDRVT